ncbi:MAG: Trp biosynthesis-associated membrane protein [Pseudonocardiales bacterium]|nr:Trp biosynthesis-associated membrane protein [Pseudonocardiales bacterium]
MSGRRALWTAVGGLLAAAVVLWGGGRLLGGDAEQPLGGLALLALAGVAGAVASGGLVRRVIGGLLVVAGVAGIVLRGAPSAQALLALTGCVLLAAAGALLAWRGQAMPRLGSRYAAPGSRPPDPDLAAWRALDAGRDPTDHTDRE